MKRSSEEIRRMIVETVANAADRDISEIKEDQDLIHDLSMDSLSVYEIVVDLEAAFDMQIADEDVERLHTVNDITAYVERRMGDEEGVLCIMSLSIIRMQEDCVRILILRWLKKNLTTCQVQIHLN